MEDGLDCSASFVKIEVKMFNVLLW